MCSPCAPAATSSAPSIDVVTTKHLEPLSWVAPVLADNAKTRIFIYETGAGSPLPRAVAQHPRVTMRSKPPERDPFYSFFDHAARGSGSGDYTLFVHGHDTAAAATEPRMG